MKTVNESTRQRGLHLSYGKICTNEARDWLEIMLDWLIVGGGIHGTHLSLFLTRRKQISPERVAILDPHAAPLTLWERHTTNTGMEFLRSSHAHNLHFDPFSLVTFARTRAGEKLARFVESYSRPSLELFQAHSAHLIERYQLDRLRIQGRALGLNRVGVGWRVETADGGIEARNVIVAIGNTENPFWPEWALALREANAPVQHVFEDGFQRDKLPPWEHAVVVGGGITAAQTAMTLAMQQPGTVTLLMRHASRIHHFDSDPVWIDGRQLEPFHSTDDYNQRRAIVAEARHRGSMPPDVARDLQTAVDGGLMTVREDAIVGTEYRPFIDRKQTITFQLGSGNNLNSDCVILATGFSPKRPGGAWLDSAINEYNLPLAPDGYPIIDPSLCWAEGLYVSGPLAELEVGPVSRNFIGARLAAERIGATL